jgi:hypothetical protein
MRMVGGWGIDQAPHLDKKILTERSVEKVLFLKSRPGVLLAAYADGCVVQSGRLVSKAVSHPLFNFRNNAQLAALH